MAADLGHKKHRLYEIWCNMKARCFNSNKPDYKYWGGKGVTVCERWMDFDNFAVDMNDGYQKGLSLDRIDVKGNYCIENCRWATKIEQQNNTTTNRFIEYMGEIKTLSQWIRYFNLKASTVRQRFYVYHWPLEQCFK